MEQIKSIGGRKNARASVILTKGKGEITINGKLFTNYFPTQTLQQKVIKPFLTLDLNNKYDAKITVAGGGTTGQAEAAALGIARGLLSSDEKNRPELKTAGLLTRDPRMKERKKPGQKGARGKFQWVKR